MTRRAGGWLPCLAALGLATSCSHRLASYQDLLVGEPAAVAPAPGRNEVTVTYLGVNGYLVASGDTALLLDPYFSRFPLRSVVFKTPVSPSGEAIAYGVKQGKLPARVDGYLITHAHFDHLFDVPPLQRQLGGKVVTSETGAYLCEAAGVPRRELLASQPGQTHRLGEATVRVLWAEHDKVLGAVPYPGKIEAPLSAPPSRPSDWRLGTPLAYLIELGGKRIYFESGGVPHGPPPITGVEVDLAIVGTAVSNSHVHYAEVVRVLNPRYVLPSHQDNFFEPVEKGFQFSALANFPRIRATHRAQALPGKLILMDYFQAFRLGAD